MTERTEQQLQVFVVMERGHEHGDVMGVYTQASTAEAVAALDDWWSVDVVWVDRLPDGARERMKRIKEKAETEIAALDTLAGMGDEPDA